MAEWITLDTHHGPVRAWQALPDGTARGGVLVAAAEKYGLPIHAIGVGEGMTDLRPFDANEVARIIAGVDAGGRK